MSYHALYLQAAVEMAKRLSLKMAWIKPAVIRWRLGAITVKIRLVWMQLTNDPSLPRENKLSIDLARSWLNVFRPRTHFNNSENSNTYKVTKHLGDPRLKDTTSCDQDSAPRNIIRNIPAKLPQFPPSGCRDLAMNDWAKNVLPFVLLNLSI